MVFWDGFVQGGGVNMESTFVDVFLVLSWD